jgi:sortase A
MRRAIRVTGLLMIVGGVLCLTWALVVWRWQDPFTAIHTLREQRRLSEQYDRLLAQWQPPAAPQAPAATRTADGDARREVARQASSYRRAAGSGQPIGRIVVGRLGLSMILVEGTDADSLEKGPGRDPRTYMPGENRLVYIAGHRTTYGAPFAHIDAIRAGDSIRLELPYATFVYRATTHDIADADDLSRLRSPRHELLRLQACHPRFFATHRYLVDARLVRVEPRQGKPYELPSAARG